MHELDSANEYCPGAHDEQVLDTKAPAVAEKVPLGQPAQDEAPVPDWYVPATHDKQAPDATSLAYEPVAQFEQELAPMAAYVPAVHRLVQLLAPVLGW